MGNSYCKKCYVPAKYNIGVKSKRHSCRYHRYNKNKICFDCGLATYQGGNCRHKYTSYLSCFF